MLRMVMGLPLSLCFDCQENAQPCTLGLPKEFFGEGMDDEVREAIDKAIEFYKGRGYEIVEVSLPTTDLSVPVYYVIAT